MLQTVNEILCKSCNNSHALWLFACLDSYLGEDAGCGSDSAVHHTVENGKQAVQREGFGPQEVVTCLKDIEITLRYMWNQDYVKTMLRWSPFHFSSRSLFFVFYHGAVRRKQKDTRKTLKQTVPEAVSITSVTVLLLPQRNYATLRKKRLSVRAGL